MYFVVVRQFQEQVVDITLLFAENYKFCPSDIERKPVYIQPLLYVTEHYTHVWL